jgi:hypothetical protein
LSSFSEAFLFACSWFPNFSFSFCNCCIFYWTLSSSFPMASSLSSFSWVCCSADCSRVCAVFSALALWEPQVLLFIPGLWCSKVQGCERFRCLCHGGALLDRSQWERSSSISYVVASWAVFRLKHGGRQYWGGPKIGWNPRTRVKNKSLKNRERETKSLRKLVLTSKVVNPFTRALTPPFIGRRRDFYIPKIPSNLRNIPNVNMYKNVFYIL